MKKSDNRPAHFDRVDGTEKLVNLESLAIAEGYARAAEHAATPDEVELFAEKASIWLHGALRRIDDWKHQGIDAPDTVLNRIKTIERILAKHGEPI